MGWHAHDPGGARQPECRVTYEHQTIVFVSLVEEEFGSERIGRRLRVWIAQKTLDARQDRRDVVHGTPLVLKNVDANPTILVDVWMKETRQKAHLRRRGRILFCKGDYQVEGPALPYSVFRAARRRRHTAQTRRAPSIRGQV